MAFLVSALAALVTAGCAFIHPRMGYTRLHAGTSTSLAQKSTHESTCADAKKEAPVRPERGAAGDKARDRVALKDVALRRLEDRRLVHGRLALGGSRHWRDVESSELGSDEHLLGAERTCVRVELHFGLYKTNVVICIGT